MLGCSGAAMFETASWRREERIEKVGPLGKAAVQNKMLDAIEQDLRRAAPVDQADGMCLYLLGVVLAERWAAVLRTSAESQPEYHSLRDLVPGWMRS